jgi:hypothetical protein
MVDKIPGHDVADERKELLDYLKLERHLSGEAYKLYVTWEVTGSKSHPTKSLVPKVV